MPRALFLRVDERDNEAIITLNNDFTKAALQREVNSFIDRGSFSKRRIVRPRSIPSSSGDEDTVRVPI
jgi:hypothetical protein